MIFSPDFCATIISYSRNLNYFLFYGLKYTTVVLEQRLIMLHWYIQQAQHYKKSSLFTITWQNSDTVSWAVFGFIWKGNSFEWLLLSSMHITQVTVEKIGFTSLKGLGIRTHSFRNVLLCLNEEWWYQFHTIMLSRM